MYIILSLFDSKGEYRKGGKVVANLQIRSLDEKCAIAIEL